MTRIARTVKASTIPKLLGVGAVAMAVGCGAGYHASYSVADVQLAFERANFPLIRWSCGPDQGPKACFIAQRLHDDIGSEFFATLRDSDHSGLLVIQTETSGVSARRDKLIQRVGNFVLTYDTTAEDDLSGVQGPSLPAWVLPRVREAERQLRRIRMPSE
jgi:hypothetical protein